MPVLEKKKKKERIKNISLKRTQVIISGPDHQLIYDLVKTTLVQALPPGFTGASSPGHLLGMKGKLRAWAF
jgi:hypothetical protein